MRRGWEEAGARTMWPSADPGDAGQLRLPEPVASGAQPAQEALLHLPSVEEAGRMRLDRHMLPTSICVGCGHVRWRHTFDLTHRLICKVPKCPCQIATASNFAVAEYFGTPDTGQAPQQ